MSRATPIAGKYVPIRPLAAGGMAEVELARQVGIDGFQKLVVLKRIRPEYANDRDFVTRFLDEARTVADLRHPNIVQIYDAGCDEAGFWLAMAYVHGIAVRKLWRDAEQRKERVPLEHALHVVIGASRGLHYAHEKADREGRPLGIVHRDVSPQNLLVSFQGEVKVADFGIARADNQQHLTRPGHVWGKLDYMAPEQARGGAVTAASDQFALGIIAWELATGERLFRRETDAETLRAVLACSVPAISSRVPGFPPPVERAIAKALEPQIGERHASCAAFAAELEQAASRVPLVLSDGRLGAFLRDLYPEESKELTLGNPLVKRPALPAGVPTADRRALVAGISLAALGVAAGGWWWLASAPRRLREAEALVVEGRFEEALEAALDVLDADPVDPRARELAKQAAAAVVDRRTLADPGAAKVWADALVARHPVAQDVLRAQMRVVEVRELISKTNLSRDMRRVFDHVNRTLDTPEVALAAAHSFRSRGLDETTYLWMFTAAVEGGMPAEEIMYTDAIEVLGSVLPQSEHADAAHRLAQAVDGLRYRDWTNRMQLNGTGYALLNSLERGSDLSGRGRDHVGLLDDLVTSPRYAEFTIPDFLKAVEVASPAEQKRVYDTLRLAIADTDLPTYNRENIQRLLDIRDGKIPKPPGRPK